MLHTCGYQLVEHTVTTGYDELEQIMSGHMIANVSHVNFISICISAVTKHV